MLDRQFQLVCCIALVGACTVALGESFMLKSGGQLDGELLNPKRDSTEPYQIKTVDGIRLSLARESVTRVVMKKDVEREYEKILPTMPDSADAHIKMADWCRVAGLRNQREHHLQQVLRLDSEHEDARRALGYVMLDGKWQKNDDYQQSLGYQRYQGQWRTKQEIEIVRAKEETEAAVIEWRRTMKMWRGWIGKKRDAEAFANFRAVRDPRAAPAFVEILVDKDMPQELRGLAAEVLAQLPGNPGESALVKLALEDPNDRIRDTCLDQLVRLNSRAAVFQCIAILKNEKSTNVMINRAGQALGRLENPVATPALIDTLVTTHEITVVPGSSSSGGLGQIAPSFGGGTDGGGGGLSAGGGKPVKQKIQVKNDSVLSALVALNPGVNFAFDTIQWKRWYAQKQEPGKVNLRRGS